MPRIADGMFRDITAGVIGAAIELHRHLGPGLLESSYEECLAWELRQAGLEAARQVKLPLVYKGLTLTSTYRIDLLVERSVVVDIKAVDKLVDVHSAQVLTYLRLAKVEVGLLINFNVPVLHRGIKRFAQAVRPDGAS